MCGRSSDCGLWIGDCGLHLRSPGFTLLEVVVVLALLGVVAGIVTISIPSSEPEPVASVLAELHDARARAIRTGLPVSWTNGDVTIRFRPDGSSSGGTIVTAVDTLRIDALSGAAHVAR